MTIQRMEHVGIVADDLAATTAPTASQRQWSSLGRIGLRDGQDVIQVYLLIRR
jgi:hypothetical protein